MGCCLLLAGCGCHDRGTPALVRAEPVDRVLDGDTLVLAGGERIRLRGINAPEKGECGGEEAQTLLAALVADGVVAERTGSDRYGRTLAHLFTPDGTHLQRLLVSQGLAHVATYGEPDAWTDTLRQDEEEARAAGRGLYGHNLACPGQLPKGSEVRVVALDVDPPGDDLAPGAGESVLLEGAPGLDLGGWTVKDTSASHRLVLPTGTRLPADGRLRVYTSCGRDGPGIVHWCNRGSAVWNNGGDTAYLLDPGGVVVSWLEYRPD